MAEWTRSRGDQQVAHEFYLGNPNTSREEIALVNVLSSKVPNVEFEGWDPRLGAGAERLTPIEDLKEVWIGPHIHQVTKTNISLYAEEKRELVDWLQRNVDLFVYAPSYISGIDTKVVSLRLAIHPSAKLVEKRKHKAGEEKRATIDKGVEKLCNTRFITETKHLTWLDNIVLVLKANNK